MKYSDEDVIELCLQIANKLKKPNFVKSTVSMENNISILGGTPWEDTTLTAGYPALVVLFSELDKWFPNQRWEDTAHEYLLTLQTSMMENGFYQEISIFSGLTGIAHAVRSASKDGVRYINFLRKIDEMIIQLMNNQMLQLSGKSEGIEPFKLDVISGIVGAGRYLMKCPLKESKDVIEKSISILNGISSSILVEGNEVEGWYVPVNNLFTQSDKFEFPKGAYNLGIAHGVSGFISYLSLLKLDKHPIESASLYNMTEWLINRGEDRDYGLCWASILGIEEYTEPQINSRNTTRDAWCYGSAGIGRAVYLAGKALNNTNYIKKSKDIFENIFRRGNKKWGLEGPSFCHGYAGLMHIVSQMFQDTKDTFYKNFMYEIREYVMNFYSNENIFGFMDEEGSNKINKIGLIDGVSGILLSLLSTCDKKRDKYNWDLPFMISN
ncbi:MAG: lanthionine synthetase C family protein [Lactobacillaceae bacterium]